MLYIIIFYIGFIFGVILSAILTVGKISELEQFIADKNKINLRQKIGKE